MIKALKSLSLIGARTRFFEKCLARLEQIPVRRESFLSVLTYHRVCYPAETPDLNPMMVSTIPERFAEQMEYLAKNCHLISMDELLEVRRNNLPLPPRAVMVTFDDAYTDFEKYAWPIIRLYDIPVTLFVPTGFPDNPDSAFWWDRLYMAVCRTPGLKRIETTSGEILLKDDLQRIRVVKQIRDHFKQLPHYDAMKLVNNVCRQAGDPMPQRAVLSWQKLLELAEMGVTLGAHTQAHPLLNRVSTQIARREIVNSQEDLRRRGVDVLPIFAYPSGAFNEDVLEIAEAEGFELAFSTSRGVNDLEVDNPLCLRRINVGQNTTLPILRMQLLTCFPNISRRILGRLS